MHTKTLILLAILTGGTAASGSTVPAGDPVEGLRVATRVGCNGCHGVDGGGHQLWEEEGEFKLFSSNLTVKRDLYNDAEIDELLRQGRTHDGHVPFGMPILMFQHLSDREVRDITAWLRSIPAVVNPGLKESWFSDETRKQIEDGSHPYLEDTQPDPDNRPPAEPPVETMALGKYLAMSSCPECHGRDLNGFPGEDAPSLVIAKAYSADSFARLMKYSYPLTLANAFRSSSTSLFRTNISRNTSS